MPFEGGNARLLAEDRIPANFPTAQLVVPRKVVFKAADGVEVHGQLFAAGRGARRPAVIFVHGGPPRQMLLGWHYSDYYSNAYALNQYLASRGFVVLSVNYRLGIGYGFEFHRPPNAGAQGAAEYQDVTAAAVAWQSSPVASIAGWKSPVLLIQGDDDRNVRFSQMVDLVQRLSATGVPYEELVIPDDTHHFMKHAHWVAVDSATADYFGRKLGAPAAVRAER